MGFADDTLCLQAAQKYPTDLNKALNFLLSQNNYDNNECKDDSNVKNTEKNHELQNHANEEKKSENTLLNVVTDCNTVDECISLNRLIETLKFYQNNHNTDNKDIFCKYLIPNQQYILNDYHHILQQHLNEDVMTKNQSNLQFKLICDKIMNGNGDLICDIAKCPIYRRNNRQRETQINAINTINDGILTICIDILDSIHCYFIHSADIGYRIPLKMKTAYNHNDDNEDQKQYHDQKLSQIKSHLQSQRKRLEKIRGVNRLESNKFMTDIPSIDISNHHIQQSSKPHLYHIIKNGIDAEDAEDTQARNYSFGQRYNYWLHDNYDNLPSRYRAKYSSLKAEMLFNKVYCIDKKTFDFAYKKAHYLLQNSHQLLRLKSNIDARYNKRYRIKSALPMQIENVLSVIFYTDYDILSYNFSSSFRNLNPNESEWDVSERNREYFNWSKLLTETVNCYGTPMGESNISALYHGVSFLYVDKFIAQFDSPTSTTTQLSVAATFASGDGIILELDKYTADRHSIYLRYFNCSFISCFGNEDERLFMQPPENDTYYLKFVSIRNLATNEQYGEIIDILTHFEQLINTDNRELSSKISLQCMDKINNLMDDALLSCINTHNYPDYIVRSFEKWTNRMDEISIYNKSLREYAAGFKIWDSRHTKLIRYDKLNAIFKKISKVSCYSSGLINSSYLDSLLLILQEVNKLRFSELEEIWLFQSKFGCSKSELKEHQSLFEMNNWQIKQYHDGKIQIFRYL